MTDNDRDSQCGCKQSNEKFIIKNWSQKKQIY